MYGIQMGGDEPTPKKTTRRVEPKVAQPQSITLVQPPQGLTLRETAAVATLQGLAAFQPNLDPAKAVSKARMWADLLVAELAVNKDDSLT